MGQSSAATVREIEDIRDRLDAGVRELERRFPQPAVWARRLVGIGVGVAVGSFVLRRVAKRARGRRLPARRATRGGPVPAVIQVLPEDGRWKQWAAAGAGVWLAVRLLELRQLRRLNRRPAGARV
jgi:hypothetical protein